MIPMPTREGRFFVYDGSDIHNDSIVIEILDYTASYREDNLPILYLCRDCGDAARMMEELAIHREEADRVKRMERASDFFFQVQRTRLVSLEPVDTNRKWRTFTKIIEAYNLGETGDCCFLDDYIKNKGRLMLETVYDEGSEGREDRLGDSGNEQRLAELVNRYNKKVLSTWH
jgi:hypothetical protein